MVESSATTSAHARQDPTIAVRETLRRAADALDALDPDDLPGGADVGLARYAVHRALVALEPSLPEDEEVDLDREAN